jgi:hypothetical protein
MSNDDRIAALAQDIYLARHNQKNSVTGQDLTDFLDATISWVNQIIPEIQKAKDPVGQAVDWNFVRTNDTVIGSVTSGTTISYPIDPTIRKLVINPHRDVTIRQDGTVISSFKLVNANQVIDPTDADTRDRATFLKHKLIFSRPMNVTELGGEIVADTVSWIPQLSHTDVSLLDILDDDPDIRQLFVLGVLKNQMLPDIVQGGLTPSYSQKFADYLAECIADNNLSADADDTDRESFGWVTGVSF